MLSPPTRQLKLFSREFRRMRARPVSFFRSLAEDLGDVAGVRVGPIRMCLLNHPEYLRQFFIAPPGQFWRGGFYHMAKAVMGEGLITVSDGEAHRRQRRLARPAFQPRRIETYSPRMVSCAERLSDRWTAGDCVDFYDQMSRLTLDIAAGTLFGTTMAGNDEEVIRDAVNTILGSWNELSLGIAVLMHKLGLPYIPPARVRRVRRQLDQIIYRTVAERRRQPDAGADLLSFLIQARDEDDGTGMNDRQLRDELVTFLLAGHETIATSLTWVWYALATNPEVEARLHAELQRVLGGRSPTADDLPELEYTRCIFQETLRMYPAVWLISRTALRDCQFGPYQIRRGTQVLVSPLIMQRTEQYYAEPEKFRPERWSSDSPERPAYTFLPFGGGPRLCIGEPFAMIEGPLVIATLAQKWRARLVPGKPIEYSRGIILRPRNGLWMTLERRDPARAARSAESVRSVQPLPSQHCPASEPAKPAR